ncbi:hypothetical protein DFH08DRAFT_1032351 [Mycena albidolilacea]|uniref:Aminoglycoside phosphotransferase domain-containing protein n=1 Tax=Mycena albidolilacea TaxID=1033008 RepID=A0AAD7ALK4_9AGAR|nr:hypothetical protein DFH08DRAFT_1032351 [Mycena albidolilacea]
MTQTAQYTRGHHESVVEHCKAETRMNRVVPVVLVALPVGCASGADDMCCAALFGKEGKHEEKTGGSVVRVPAGEWERCVEWTLARWIHPTPTCPPNPWIGTASGRAFWDPVVSDEDPEDGWGPYVDLAAFNDARVALFDKFARIHPPIADQLRAYRRDMRDDLPVVFTHADIHRENVLLKQSSDGTQVDVLALLDWGCAGWRPIFWEGYKSAWLGHNFKVWGELGPRLFAGYEGEVELEKTLLQVNGGMPP